MRTKTRIVAALSCIAILVLSASSCSKAPQEDAKQRTPIEVEATSPSSHLSSSYDISGKVEAKQIANISTKLMGYITRINVKVGDRVIKGQLLATIESQDIQAKRAQAQAMVAEAEASLAITEKDYNRFQQLYNKQSASTKEVENVTLQYTSARSRLEAAKQVRNEASSMLAYTQLRAPFAGTVVQKAADPGSMASPGMPILTIEQNGAFQVKAILPESYIGATKIGDAVTVSIKSIGKTFKAQVSELSTSSLNTGGQYVMLVSIPSSEIKGLYSGQYANVSIEHKVQPSAAQAKGAILIPTSSIIRKDQLTGVYTISQNSKALLRWVRLGKPYGTTVEVLSGVATNDRVITKSKGKLYNGASVKVK